MDSKYNVVLKVDAPFLLPLQKSQVPAFPFTFFPSISLLSLFLLFNVSSSAFLCTPYGCPPDLRHSRWRLLPSLYPSQLSFIDGTGADRSLHVQAPYLFILSLPLSTTRPVDSK